MIRACGYGRVSTDEETQLNALASQIEEINNCILKNEWIKTNIYVDEGKSGTSTKKRDEYNRLMNDMKSDKWDIIVVKSQDRLMRSAKDWYIFVDALVKNNKKLFFYIENKFYTPDDSLITGIKAILAEDYSRELSKKEKNAHRTRRINAIQNGTNNGRSVILTNNTWGYNKINREVVINKEEAEIVRKIYQLAAFDNYGSRLISKHLTSIGILGRNEKPISEGVIRKIIRNPLYKGTVVMNKKSYDFSTKQTNYNKEDDVVYIENGVPRIVEDTTWELANRNMDLRSKNLKSDTNSKKRIGVKIGQNKYSGKIFCGECNSVFWLKNRRLKTTNRKITDWYCSNYIKFGKGKCENVHLTEEMLDKIMKELAKKIIPENHDKEFEYAIESIQSIISDSDIKSEINELELKISETQKRQNSILDKMVDGVIDEETYKRTYNRYSEEIISYEQKLADLNEKIKTIMDREKRMKEIKKRFNLMKESNELSSTDIIKIVNRIIVHKTHVVIETEIGEKYDFSFKITTKSRRYNNGKTTNDIEIL